jgi:hypothetical protein
MTDPFTRSALSFVTAELRKAFPSIKTSEAGLTCSKIGSRRHYFFQFGDWHWEGVAYDANDARAKAWARYLDEHKLYDLTQG